MLEQPKIACHLAFQYEPRPIAQTHTVVLGDIRRGGTRTTLSPTRQVRVRSPDHLHLAELHAVPTVHHGPSPGPPSGLDDTQHSVAAI
jgi:hypothetical protein